jgi:hypothetical protein
MEVSGGCATEVDLFEKKPEMQRRRGRRFCSCFSGLGQQGRGMSLNRCEQRVFDYLQSHREERHFWEAKVRAVSQTAGGDHEAARRLDGELWRYYLERSAVVSPFKEAARLEGLARTSMKNLAELLLRLWTEPRPKKKPAEERP